MDFNNTRYIPMSRRRRIYEGKAKVLYEGPEPGTLIQHFKDDATAFNAKKHQIIEGKGVLNNRISEYLFQRLNDIGVPTHFIRRLNMREQLVREVEIIPLSVAVRTLPQARSPSASSSLRRARNCRARSSSSDYKNKQLRDSMVSEEHITAFGWATPQEIDDIPGARHPRQRLPVRPVPRVSIRLVDFKMEYGRLWENDLMRIVVADEISRTHTGCGISSRTARSDRIASAATSAGCSGLYRCCQAARHRERERAPAGTGPVLVKG